MEITGKIIVIKNTEQVTDTFAKRDIVVETLGQYPQQILIQFTQDKVDLLNNFKEGEEVAISFNLRCRKSVGREGQDVWYNTLQGWKIAKA